MHSYCVYVTLLDADCRLYELHWLDVDSMRSSSKCNNSVQACLSVMAT